MSQFKRIILVFNKTADRKIIADLLIENGANVRYRDVYGVTPLHMAVAYGIINLFEKCYQFDNNQNTGSKCNYSNNCRSRSNLRTAY